MCDCVPFGLGPECSRRLHVALIIDIPFNAVSVPKLHSIQFLILLIWICNRSTRHDLRMKHCAFTAWPNDLARSTPGHHSYIINIITWHFKAFRAKCNKAMCIPGALQTLEVKYGHFGAVNNVFTPEWEISVSVLVRVIQFLIQFT